MAVLQTLASTWAPRFNVSCQRQASLPSTGACVVLGAPLARLGSSRVQRRSWCRCKAGRPQLVDVLELRPIPEGSSGVSLQYVDSGGRLCPARRPTSRDRARDVVLKVGIWTILSFPGSGDVWACLGHVSTLSCAGSKRHCEGKSHSAHAHASLQPSDSISSGQCVPQRSRLRPRSSVAPVFVVAEQGRPTTRRASTLTPSCETEDGKLIHCW